MKLLIALVLGFALCSEAEWFDFQVKYNKVYSSKQEARKRFHIFKKNLDEIKKHNEQGLSFEMGINKFSDLTYEEFAAVYLMKPQQLEEYESSVSEFTPVDWRDKGAVTAVKDQAQCGSCYSFGAIGTVEGRCQIHTGQLFDLADQQCVDCGSSQGNQGCNGGMPEKCLRHYQAVGGVMQSKDYKYTARAGSCQFDKSKAVVAFNSFTNKAGESYLQKAIPEGPVALCLYATSKFQSYKSGIFVDTSCPSWTINHALVGVGLGNEGGQDYYIIKNSWGTGWGEKGYIRFASKNNMCDVGGSTSWLDDCHTL